jgi:hypothetical protein
MKDVKDTLLTLTDEQIVTRRTALGIAAAVGATALIATPAWADTESDADGEEEENDSTAGDNETEGEDEEEADADGG